MKFDVNSINCGYLFYRSFENATSSNVDKGDVWCDTPYFHRLVDGHCSPTGPKRPVVQFNDEDGSFSNFEGDFANPFGKIFYIFKTQPNTWNRTRFNIITKGRSEGEIAIFHS